MEKTEESSKGSPSARAPDHPETVEAHHDAVEGKSVTECEPGTSEPAKQTLVHNNTRHLKAGLK